MTGQVLDNATGLRRLRERLKAMSKSSVRVGVQEGARRHGDTGASNMVVVAAANEFGTEHIPERSFLRSTFDESREEAARLAKAEQVAVLSGRRDVRTSLTLLGQWFAARVVRKIHSHPPPPNAPATVERKGSSGTLVDSGQLAQSITYEVVEGGRR